MVSSQGNLTRDTEKINRVGMFVAVQLQTYIELQSYIYIYT